MKKVAIHQPNFIPWLGYFYKMEQCDTFILLDDVQVSTGGSYFSQAFIKNSQKSKFLVSLPQKKHDAYCLIKDVEFAENYPLFLKKFLKTLQRFYSQAPFFNKHYESLVSIFQRSYDRIWEMNADLIRYCASQLNIHCEILVASDLKSEKQKEERIIDLVQKVGGDVYISGKGAANYQKEEDFQKVGIQLVYSDFKIKPYNQIHGDFIGGLSVIDYLFNV